MKEVGYEDWLAESERIKGWERLTQTHRCAVCHAGLVVRWNPETSQMELACSQDKSHQGIEPYSATKERIRRFTMEDTKALVKRAPQALATEAQAKWPKDLTLDQAREFVRVCLDYGFDPLLGELIPYQGRPYITLDARLRRAQKHHSWGGWAEMRPATPEEKEARGYDPNDFVAVVKPIRKNTTQPLIFGRVSVEERDKQRKTEMDRHGTVRAPVVLDPYAHAEKRAMHKALRQAFADTIQAPNLAGLEEVGVVDVETWELIEGLKPKELPEAMASQERQGMPSDEAPRVVDGPPPAQGTPSEPKADPQHGQEAPPPQGKAMTPTEFWTEARKLGYDDATKTELVLGKTVPRWIREGGTYRTALVALQAARTKAPKEV